MNNITYLECSCLLLSVCMISLLWFLMHSHNVLIMVKEAPYDLKFCFHSNVEGEIRVLRFEIKCFLPILSAVLESSALSWCLNVVGVQELLCCEHCTT